MIFQKRFGSLPVFFYSLIVTCTLAVFPRSVHALIAFVNSSREGVDSGSYYEIFVMNNDGSDPRQLTNNEFFETDPLWSPDGELIAFYSSRGKPGYGDIFTMRPDGTSQFNVTNDPDRAYYEHSWSPDGQSLVSRSSTVPFSGADLYTFGVDGSGLALIPNLTGEPSYPQWSPAGDRVAAYTWDDGVNPAGIVMIDTDGTDRVEVSGAGSVFQWSPDGTRLVYVKEGIWAVNADGSDPVELFNPGAGFYPTSLEWSPDGTRVAFISNHESPEVFSGAVYLMDADGKNVRRVSGFMDMYGDLDWSADQKHLVFIVPEENATHIYRLDLDTSSVTRLTTTGYNSKPRFSPLLEGSPAAPTVPEPGSAFLLGAGLAMAFLRRKK